MPTAKTIIIDDSDFFQKMIQDICQSIGLSVIETFSNGEIFLQKLKSGMFQDCELLLLDINLPGISGKDLLEDILEELPELIVIMISSLSGMNTVNECLTAGASNYINKDTSPEKMKEILTKTLKMNGF